MTTSAIPASITPSALAERLAAGDPTTIIDVRTDADWTIEGGSVTNRHVPSALLMADPGRLAAELDPSAPAVLVCNRGITAENAAEALRAAGAEVSVLEGGLRGWIGTLRAHPVELGVAGLQVLQVQRPGRGCLSYLVAAGERALVVDPAPDAAYYVELAAGIGARVTDVVDTHLHADHLSGARELARTTGATLRLPTGAVTRGITYADAIVPLADGDTIALGDVEVRALHLPGHTTDMTGLVVAGRALLGGDSLFADGIARPDLEEGDPAGSRRMAHLLHRTLHERVLTLGDDVVLLPGHAHPGVHDGAVAPTLAEVRAAVPELALSDPDAFADDVLADMPPRPANYEAVIAVNAGRHPFDPELESGGNSCSAR